ncbi:MAG: V-type ATPase subunit, partial [Planctomycetota bacterium]
MKGRLLPEAFFLELLEQKELMKVADSLLSSPYGEDMSVALAGDSGLLAVEKALRRNLYRVFRKVFQMCSEEPHRLLRVLLGKWDVYNIKTVLRGKQRGLPAKEVLSALVPAGELDEPKLQELLYQPDVKAVIDTLATWLSPFAPPLLGAFPEYLENGQLAVLEKALDRYYFNWVLSETSLEGENNEGFVREIIKREIDYQNLLSALKIISGRFEAVEVEFFPGGNLSGEYLSGAKSLEEVLTGLKKAYPDLDGRLAEGAESPSDVEHIFYCFLLKKWSDMVRKDPLSIAIVLGFLG